MTESADQAVTLDAFLLARIHEDATEACSPEWELLDSSLWMGHAATWNRKRAVAECEAKKKITEECMAAVMDPARGIVAWESAKRMLQALALVYEHHPDYREAWRP